MNTIDQNQGNQEALPQNADEQSLKMIADLRMENQSLKQQLEQVNSPTAETGDPGIAGAPGVPSPAGTDGAPSGERGFETLENLESMGGGGDTPINQEVAAIRGELDQMKKEKAVHDYADENNVTSEGKAILMKAVMEKNMVLEDAVVYAQGAMQTGAAEAIGSPTPGQSEAQVQQQEEAQQKAANPNPAEMSKEDLEKSAEAQFEEAYRSGTSITA